MRVVDANHFIMFNINSLHIVSETGIFLDVSGTFHIKLKAESPARIFVAVKDVFFNGGESKMFSAILPSRCSKILNVNDCPCITSTISVGGQNWLSDLVRYEDAEVLSEMELSFRPDFSTDKINVDLDYQEANLVVDAEAIITVDEVVDDTAGASNRTYSVSRKLSVNVDMQNADTMLTGAPSRPLTDKGDTW